jgi:hypothetical protein
MVLGAAGSVMAGFKCPAPLSTSISVPVPNFPVGGPSPGKPSVEPQRLRSHVGRRRSRRLPTEMNRRNERASYEKASFVDGS